MPKSTTAPSPGYTPGVFDDIYSIAPDVVTQIVLEAVRRNDYATVEACLDSGIVVSSSLPKGLDLALSTWLGSDEEVQSQLAQRWNAKFGQTLTAVLSESALRLCESRQEDAILLPELKRLMSAGADPEAMFGRSNLIQRAIELGTTEVLRAVVSEVHRRHPDRLPMIGKRNAIDYVLSHKGYLEHRLDLSAILAEFYDFSDPKLRDQSRKAYERYTGDEFFSKFDFDKVRVAMAILKSGCLERSDLARLLARDFEEADIDYDKNLAFRDLEAQRAPLIECLFGAASLARAVLPGAPGVEQAIGRVVQDLVDLGLDLNDQKVVRCRALEVAMTCGAVEFVEIALKAGADPSQVYKNLKKYASLPGMDPKKIALIGSAVARDTIRAAASKGKKARPNP